MARQNVGAGARSSSYGPETPLTDYAPGALQRLTPEQRGRALKRSKRPAINPNVTTPNTILSRK